ncbi:MAG: ribosome biogenesis GTPase Der [Beggiatoa sp. IS2]|nr:MAG: ribosome biogenesis GTPase Der [Beggiatoa sp. IS2]
MIPTLAIVGRPNVGKSTLFNALTQTRAALVADQPGLTRDRQYGKGQINGRIYWVIDTGGFCETTELLAPLVVQQALLAIQAADKVLFLVDGREGLTPLDESIAQQLRRLSKPLHLVINKTEGLDNTLVSADFHRLGIASMHSIAAAHRRGIKTLIENVLADFPEAEAPPETQTGIKVAIVGRPNVGKSTLVNRLLGYERVIVSDQAGTTRDSIYVPFERDGQCYTLIDTAGIRRRAKVTEVIEKFSVIKTLQTIDSTHVVIMLLDAREGATEQDASLLGSILESGRALVMAVNKWDGLDASQREHIRYHLSRRLHFVDFAQTHFISALHGTEVGHLFPSIIAAYQSAHCPLNTAQLNDALQQAVADHPPPLIHGRRIKLRYVHQAGHNPPLFIVHGNQVNEIPTVYERYLINTFRKKFALVGTPIRFEFKQGENPYEGRKNTLTLHQLKKRQRLLRHVKS